jgi:hypothetical protein
VIGRRGSERAGVGGGTCVNVRKSLRARANRLHCTCRHTCTRRQPKLCDDVAVAGRGDADPATQAAVLDDPCTVWCRRLLPAAGHTLRPWRAGFRGGLPRCDVLWLRFMQLVLQLRPSSCDCVRLRVAVAGCTRFAAAPHAVAGRRIAG